MFEHAKLVEFAGRNGQDRVEVIRRGEELILVVADGAGGTSGGDEAADTMIMWARAAATREGIDVRDPKTWCDLLSRVDMQIESANGQTTAVIVAVFDRGVAGASVGDSVAWIVGTDSVDDLTTEQVRKPLLGNGNAKPVGFSRAFGDGTLLLATDGLAKYAPMTELAQAACGENLEYASRALVNLVRLKSGMLQDDVGVVLCRRGMTKAKMEKEDVRYEIGDNDVGDL